MTPGKIELKLFFASGVEPFVYLFLEVGGAPAHRSGVLVASGIANGDVSISLDTEAVEINLHCHELRNLFVPWGENAGRRLTKHLQVLVQTLALLLLICGRKPAGLHKYASHLNLLKGIMFLRNTKRIRWGNRPPSLVRLKINLSIDLISQVNGEFLPPFRKGLCGVSTSDVMACEYIPPSYLIFLLPREGNTQKGVHKGPTPFVLYKGLNRGV